jgi:amidase
MFNTNSKTPPNTRIRVGELSKRFAGPLFMLFRPLCPAWLYNGRPLINRQADKPMSFTPPNRSDVESIAEELNISLNSQEIGRIHDYLAPFAQGYEFLDTQDDALPPILAPRREHRRPGADENAFGAWYVRTAITAVEAGPLRGKTVAIKDNICVAGVPMMDGAAMLEGLVPDIDAPAVTRLLRAGAEIAGKSVCEFMCMSGGSATASNGPVDNPRKRGYSTGGSSSGSAALVAAGEVDLALGTDQGGSVRIPASWTGVVGMKATRGVVPYTGGVPMETSIDYIGPLTRTVEDNALVLEVLAGKFDEPTGEPVGYTREYAARLGDPIDGLRIGVMKEGFGHPLSEPDVDECVRAAVARLAAAGAKLSEVSVPEHLTGPAIWGAIVTDGVWSTLRLNGLGYNYEGVYSPALFRAMNGWQNKIDAMPTNAKVLMVLGKYMERYKGYYYGKAKNLVSTLRGGYRRAFSSCDLLLMPTTVQKAGPNPQPGDDNYIDALMAQAFNNTLNACQFNATGYPALSLPCGMRDGLPVGLMLVGPDHCEDRIYQAAYALQDAGDWQTW